MTFRNTLLAASALLALSGGAAFAADAPKTPDLVIAYNFGVATDYAFRGITQTGEQASAFAGVDLTYKTQFYAGLWTSNIDFTGFNTYVGPTQEVDVYAGWKPTVGPVNLDLGVIYYGYVDQFKGEDADYTELYAKGSEAFGPLTLGAAVYYSPNYGGPAKAGYYVEGNAAYTINPKWAVSGAIGYQEENKGDTFTALTAQDFDYTTWTLGVTYTISDHFSADLRYVDTSDHKYVESFAGIPSAGNARVIGTLKATF